MEITKVTKSTKVTIDSSIEDIIAIGVSPHKQNYTLEPNPLIECERLACRKTAADKVELSKNRFDEAKLGKMERALIRGKRVKPSVFKKLIKPFLMLFM